jgi:membrane-anchored protein YejM (alkaline phosphatase superfamily)
VGSPSVAAVKPDLQSYFLGFGNEPHNYGAVGTVPGSSWTDFLNYYLAVIANVDASVGLILNKVTVSDRTACPTPTGDLTNTVIIFTSDHADHGGAHGLHGKGGAVYEESLRVPLYVHFLNQRSPASGCSDYAGFQRYQMTSSVDLFTLVMDLGNNRHGHVAHGVLPEPASVGLSVAILLSLSPQRN